MTPKKKYVETFTISNGYSYVKFVPVVRLGGLASARPIMRQYYYYKRPKVQNKKIGYVKSEVNFKVHYAINLLGVVGSQSEGAGLPSLALYHNWWPQNRWGELA